MSTATLEPELISVRPVSSSSDGSSSPPTTLAGCSACPTIPARLISPAAGLIVAVREQLPPEQSHAAAIDEQEAALARLRERFEGRFRGPRADPGGGRRAARGHLAARDARPRSRRPVRGIGVRARDRQPGQGRSHGRRGGALRRRRPGAAAASVLSQLQANPVPARAPR